VCQACGAHPRWARIEAIARSTTQRGQVSRIAIVGAGFVGATTAYALLLSGTAAEIVLIDRHPERAKGHVNDLRDAALFSHNTRIVAGDLGDCGDADVIIITSGVSQAGITSRLDNLKESAPILKDIIEKSCLPIRGGLC
jgi:L-lactate dehydrogenase